MTETQGFESERYSTRLIYDKRILRDNAREIICYNCSSKKPLLFGGFIKCNRCDRIYCPECVKEFEYIGGYPRKNSHTKCPECKYIGFKSIW